MKSYKFTTKAGETYKVRLYDTEIYTITDKSGEHEVGMWRRRDGGYAGRGFSENFEHFSFKMEVLAYWLLRSFMHRK